MDEDEKPETTEDETTDTPEDSEDESTETPEDSEGEQPSEFAALSDLLAQVLQGIADIRADMANAVQVSNARAVDNGASITDTGIGDADVEIVDEMPTQPEDRDYSI